MQAFVMLFLMFATLISNCVYSLPAVNFTDAALSNQKIKMLSEALLAQDEQQQSVRPDSRGKHEL